MSKTNLLRTNFVFGIDRLIQVKSRFPSSRLYLMFGLYKILVSSGFCLDRFIHYSGFVRVMFRQVSLYKEIQNYTL